MWAKKLIKLDDFKIFDSTKRIAPLESVALWISFHGVVFGLLFILYFGENIWFNRVFSVLPKSISAGDTGVVAFGVVRYDKRNLISLVCRVPGSF